MGWTEYFQTLLIYWDFATQPSPESTENGPKKQKKKKKKIVLIMPQVRGEWPDCFRHKQHESLVSVVQPAGVAY